MALSAQVIENGNGSVGIESRSHITEVYIQITASGSYTTGGDTLDLTAFLGVLGQFGVPGDQLPLWADIQSLSSSGDSGYVYALRPGATQAGCKLQVFQCAGSAAPFAELAQTTYPAGVTGDTIVGRLTFLRG